MLSELLKVDGIDVFFLGPSDLSQALGIPGHANDPRVWQLIEDCAAKITAAGKIAGTVCQTADRANWAIAQGVRYITVGSSVLYASAGKGYLGGVKR